MPQKSPYDGPLTLELADGPEPAHGVPGSGIDAPKTEKAADQPSIVDTDDSLAEATREFDQGRIDGSLWTQCVAASPDKAQAKSAYLRERATALQALKNDQTGPSAVSRSLTPPASSGVSVGTASRPPGSAAKSDRGKGGNATVRLDDRAPRPTVVPVSKADRDERSDAAVWLRSPAGILAMLTLLVAAGTATFALWPHDSAIDATAVGVAPGGDRSASSVPSRQVVQEQGILGTIQNLKRTRNWNEVVAQASAWTQREPQDAAAWNELSIGYANTQQREEAHAAARRAVELAPKNALYWRNLGDLILDRDSPVEALLAFEEATSWDTRDAYSFVQAGILNARLDRLQEAKVAFGKALALNPNDADARCGAAWIARRLTQSRENAKPEPPADGACRDLIARASVPVSLMGPTASSGAASGNR